MSERIQHDVEATLWALGVVACSESDSVDAVRRRALDQLAENQFDPESREAVAIQLLAGRSIGGLSQLERAEINDYRRRKTYTAIEEFIDQVAQLTSAESNERWEQLRRSAEGEPDLLAQLERVRRAWDLELESSPHPNFQVEAIRAALIRSEFNRPPVAAWHLRKLFAKILDAPHLWKTVISRFIDDCPRLAARRSETVKHLKALVVNPVPKIPQRDVASDPASELWGTVASIAIFAIGLLYGMLIWHGEKQEQKLPKNSVQFEVSDHTDTDAIAEVMLRRKPPTVQPNGRTTQRQSGNGPKVLFIVIKEGFTGDLEFTKSFHRNVLWHFVQESNLEPNEKVRVQDLLYDPINEVVPMPPGFRALPDEIRSPEAIIDFLELTHLLSDRQLRMIRANDGRNHEFLTLYPQSGGNSASARHAEAESALSTSSDGSDDE